MKSTLDYTPTPEEIKAASEKIQAGWSESERAKRAGVELSPVTFQAFAIGPRGVAVAVEELVRSG